MKVSANFTQNYLQYPRPRSTADQVNAKITYLDRSGTIYRIIYKVFSTLTGVFSVTVTGDFEVPLGSTSTIRCIVDALPIPVLTWERPRDNGDDILVETQLQDAENYGVLQRTFTLSDNGTWACRVSGGAGGHEELFTVIVLGKYKR